MSLISRIFYSHFFLFLEIYKLFYYYFKWQSHKGLYMKYFKLIVNLLLYHHRTTLYTCFFRSTPKTLKTLYVTSVEYLSQTPPSVSVKITYLFTRRTATVEVFDGTSWKVQPYKLTSARYSHCAVPIRYTLYLYILIMTSAHI